MVAVFNEAARSHLELPTLDQFHCDKSFNYSIDVRLLDFFDVRMLESNVIITRRFKTVSDVRNCVAAENGGKIATTELVYDMMVGRALTILLLGCG